MVDSLIEDLVTCGVSWVSVHFRHHPTLFYATNFNDIYAEIQSSTEEFDPSAA